MRAVLHKEFVGAKSDKLLVRGVWMILDSAMLQRRWVKILPHANDIVAVALTRDPLAGLF